MLTAETRIRVKAPLPLPQKATRPPLSGDTKIRLSQIVDLKKWVEDQRQYQLGEISETTGLMKTPDGWVTPPQFGRHQEPHKEGHSHVAGGSKKNNSGKKTKTRKRSIKPIPITKTQTVVKRDGNGKVIDTNWEIKAGEYITNAEVMAEGTDIRNVDRLVNENPGTKPEEWTKEKGVGIISPKKGAKKKNGKPITKARHAELHWYKSEKTGVIEIKRTRWMD